MNLPNSLSTALNSISSQLTISAAVFLTASQTLAQSYTIVDLGTLGGAYSFAMDINNVGQITGDTSLKGNPEVAVSFLWENGVMIDIGTLGNSSDESYSTAINNIAQICGSSEPVNVPFHAFCWQDGVMKDLGTLGGVVSNGNDINDLGDVVGLSYPLGNSEYHAVLWTGGKIIDLGVLSEGHNTQAFGINNSQEVVGWGYVGGASPLTLVRGFLWRNGVMQLLPGLVGGDSDALAINEAGCIAGNSRAANGAMHPVIWLSKESPNIPIVDLGVPTPFVFGFSHDLNNVGLVVGEYWESCGWEDICAHPFIWENGEIKMLDNLIPSDSGWDLDFAVAINDLGQIVGRGTTPNGQRHGFLLNPIIPGDLDGDFVVSTTDLLLLFSAWGPCVDCDACEADLDDDCEVGTSDLLILFSNWG